MAERKSATRDLVQLRTGRDLEEHLRELYLERRFTDQEIADSWGIHRITVVMWRKEFGIARADRKTALTDGATA